MSLFNIVQKMKGVRALVIGDAIIDEYRFGHSDRLCPEAPVPVFVEDRMEVRDGGAANVFAQVKALSHPVEQHLSTPASRKTRYMVGQQMLLRVDEDCRFTISHDRRVGQVRFLINDHRPSVVILSDYDKGWLSPLLCQETIGMARAARATIIVDPKGANWRKYAGADWLCPNQKEWESFSERMQSMPTSNILWKRGAEGLRLCTDGSGHVDIPATAKAVFDVTGAGDTVVAVFALALGAGGSPVEAAQIANLAAGYVVGEVGTTVCPRAVLEALVKDL